MTLVLQDGVTDETCISLNEMHLLIIVDQLAYHPSDTSPLGIPECCLAGAADAYSEPHAPRYCSKSGK